MQWNEGAGSLPRPERLFRFLRDFDHIPCIQAEEYNSLRDDLVESARLFRTGGGEVEHQLALAVAIAKLIRFCHFDHHVVELGRPVAPIMVPARPILSNRPQHEKVSSWTDAYPSENHGIAETGDLDQAMVFAEAEEEGEGELRDMGEPAFVNKVGPMSNHRLLRPYLNGQTTFCEETYRPYLNAIKSQLQSQGRVELKERVEVCRVDVSFLDQLIHRTQRMEELELVPTISEQMSEFQCSESAAERMKLFDQDHVFLLDHLRTSIEEDLICQFIDSGSSFCQIPDADLQSTRQSLLNELEISSTTLWEIGRARRRCIAKIVSRGVRFSHSVQASLTGDKVAAVARLFAMEELALTAVQSNAVKWILLRSPASNALSTADSRPQRRSETQGTVSRERQRHRRMFAAATNLKAQRSGVGEQTSIAHLRERRQASRASRSRRPKLFPGPTFDPDRPEFHYFCPRCKPEGSDGQLMKTSRCRIHGDRGILVRCDHKYPDGACNGYHARKYLSQCRREREVGNKERRFREMALQEAVSGRRYVAEDASAERFTLVTDQGKALRVTLSERKVLSHMPADAFKGKEEALLQLLRESSASASSSSLGSASSSNDESSAQIEIVEQNHRTPVRQEKANDQIPAQPGVFEDNLRTPVRQEHPNVKDRLSCAAPKDRRCPKYYAGDYICPGKAESHSTNHVSLSHLCDYHARFPDGSEVMCGKRCLVYGRCYDFGYHNPTQAKRCAGVLAGRKRRRRRRRSFMFATATSKAASSSPASSSDSRGLSSISDVGSGSQLDLVRSTTSPMRRKSMRMRSDVLTDVEHASSRKPLPSSDPVPIPPVSQPRVVYVPGEPIFDPTRLWRRYPLRVFDRPPRSAVLELLPLLPSRLFITPELFLEKTVLVRAMSGAWVDGELIRDFARILSDHCDACVRLCDFVETEIAALRHHPLVLADLEQCVNPNAKPVIHFRNMMNMDLQNPREGAHWFVIVIDPEKHVVFGMDSSPDLSHQPRKDYAESCIQIICEDFGGSSDFYYEPSLLTVERQPDGRSCGLRAPVNVGRLLTGMSMNELMSRSAQSGFDRVIEMLISYSFHESVVFVSDGETLRSKAVTLTRDSLLHLLEDGIVEPGVMEACLEYATSLSEGGPDWASAVMTSWAPGQLITMNERAVSRWAVLCHLQRNWLLVFFASKTIWTVWGQREMPLVNEAIHAFAVSLDYGFHEIVGNRGRATADVFVLSCLRELRDQDWASDPNAFKESMRTIDVWDYQGTLFADLARVMLPLDVDDAGGGDELDVEMFDHSTIPPVADSEATAADQKSNTSSSKSSQSVLSRKRKREGADELPAAKRARTSTVKATDGEDWPRLPSAATLFELWFQDRKIRTGCLLKDLTAVNTLTEHARHKLSLGRRDRIRLQYQDVGGEWAYLTTPDDFDFWIGADDQLVLRVEVENGSDFDVLKVGPDDDGDSGSDSDLLMIDSDDALLDVLTESPLHPEVIVISSTEPSPSNSQLDCIVISSTEPSPSNSQLDCVVISSTSSSSSSSPPSDSAPSPPSLLSMVSSQRPLPSRGSLDDPGAGPFQLDLVTERSSSSRFPGTRRRQSSQRSSRSKGQMPSVAFTESSANGEVEEFDHYDFDEILKEYEEDGIASSSEEDDDDRIILGGVEDAELEQESDGSEDDDDELDELSMLFEDDMAAGLFADDAEEDEDQEALVASILAMTSPSRTLPLARRATVLSPSVPLPPPPLPPPPTQRSVESDSSSSLRDSVSATEEGALPEPSEILIPARRPSDIPAEEIVSVMLEHMRKFPKLRSMDDDVSSYRVPSFFPVARGPTPVVDSFVGRWVSMRYGEEMVDFQVDLSQHVIQKLMRKAREAFRLETDLVLRYDTGEGYMRQLVFEDEVNDFRDRDPLPLIEVTTYDSILASDSEDETLAPGSGNHGGGRRDDLDGGDGSAGLRGGDGSAGLRGGDGSAGLRGGDGSAGLRGGDGSAGLRGGDGSASLRGGDGSAGLRGGDGSSGLESERQIMRVPHPDYSRDGFEKDSRKRTRALEDQQNEYEPRRKRPKREEM